MNHVIKEQFYKGITGKNDHFLIILQLSYMVKRLNPCYIQISYTVKPVLWGHSKIDKTKVLLNEGGKYCRMLSRSILQYFRPALRDNQSVNSILVCILSDCLRQVLL